MLKTCLHPQKFESKPDKQSCAIISSSIGSHNCSLSFKDFVTALGAGQTFTAGASFKNGARKATAWEGQQLFCADIDHANFDINASIDSFCVSPAIIYESFSSTESHRKYRIIWVLKDINQEHSVCLSVLRKIKRHFNCDPCIVDLARLFFGTSEDRIVFAEEKYCEIGDFMLTSEDLAFSNKKGEELKAASISDIDIYPNPKQYIALKLEREKLRKSKNGRKHLDTFFSTIRVASLGIYTLPKLEAFIIYSCRLNKEFDLVSDNDLRNIVRDAVKWSSKCDS